MDDSIKADSSDVDGNLVALMELLEKINTDDPLAELNAFSIVNADGGRIRIC